MASSAVALLAFLIAKVLKTGRITVAVKTFFTYAAILLDSNNY